MEKDIVERLQERLRHNFSSDPHRQMADAIAEIEALRSQRIGHFDLAKRPVAWRVKDFGDGWIIYQDEAGAYADAEHNGAVMQGLYVRDGLDASADQN